MFPYTADEAEWLSAHADRHYWLLGQGDIAPATPGTHANDDVAPQDRRSAP
jgi:hypothetical protein